MKLTNVTEEYAIYGMLFSLSNRIQTIGDKIFENITLKQQFMMIALELFEEPPTLKQMGELIGCSYQNVKRMADHLEKEGYIVLQQDYEDKRKIRIVSTGKMAEIMQKNMKVSMDFIKQLYTEIPREDLQVTQKTLLKMDQNIGGILDIEGGTK